MITTVTFVDELLALRTIAVFVLIFVNTKIKSNFLWWALLTFVPIGVALGTKEIDTSFTEDTWIVGFFRDCPLGCAMNTFQWKEFRDDLLRQIIA